MFKSIFVTGLGGQGVLTFTNLLATLADEQGLQVSLFHSKGMAQRGGRVSSEVRLASSAAAQDAPDPSAGLPFGSRISTGGADILVGLEIGETLNSRAFLKEGGLLLLAGQRVVPSAMVLRKEEYPTFDRVRQAFDDRARRIFAVEKPDSPPNVFLLGMFGAVASRLEPGLEFLEQALLEEAVRRHLRRGLEENLEAFRRGWALGRAEVT